MLHFAFLEIGLYKLELCFRLTLIFSGCCASSKCRNSPKRILFKIGHFHTNAKLETSSSLDKALPSEMASEQVTAARLKVSLLSIVIVHVWLYIDIQREDHTV